MNATRNGSQATPPTWPASLPVTAYTPAPRMSPTMNRSSSPGPITRLRSGSGPLTSGSAVVDVIQASRVRAWQDTIGRGGPGAPANLARGRGKVASAEEDLGLGVLLGLDQL